MSENMTVHHVPFPITTCSSDAFFYLPHNCCIFQYFESLVLVLVRIEGQEDKLRHAVYFCVFVSCRPIKLSCHLQYDSCSCPWDIQCICKVLIDYFFFINSTHLQLRCMMQSSHFISTYAMQWTFPFYTVTYVIFFVKPHIFVWFWCIEPLLITVTSKDKTNRTFSWQ